MINETFDVDTELVETLVGKVTDEKWIAAKLMRRAIKDMSTLMHCEVT